MKGRKTTFTSEEELIQHKKAYQKEYYSIHKDKYWAPDKRQPRINTVAIKNSINRIMKDDSTIKQFIDTVGSDKLLELMGYMEV